MLRTDQFLRMLKIQHATLLFVSFSYISMHSYISMFLLQAESIKGRFDTIANGAILAEESESEKMSEVWVKLSTLPFSRSAATILPFVYFPPFY